MNKVDNLVGRLVDYESGAMSTEEVVELFQELVDTGLAWQLQGHYGRAARHLIAWGRVTENKGVSDAR